MASPTTITIDSALVVGGSGFLGQAIVDQLREQIPAMKISVLDLRTERDRRPGVDYYNGDISQRTDVDRILSAVRPTVIFHTASPSALDDSRRALFDRVNIQGTDNLLAAAATLGTVRAFVYTSSASVVHNGYSNLINVDESAPALTIPDQTSYYTHTKAVAESHVLAANRQPASAISAISSSSNSTSLSSAATTAASSSKDGGRGDMLTVALRPAGIFGEADPLMIPSWLDNYEKGRTRVQIGNNRNQFDTTYVGNVAHAHLLAARALLRTATMSVQPLDFERVDGETFFITNDEPQPFWTFVRMIWHAAGWTGRAEDMWILPFSLAMALAFVTSWATWICTLGRWYPVFRPYTVRFTCINRTYNIDKAKRRLGYLPQVALADGIQKSVEWEQARRRQNKKTQ